MADSALTLSFQSMAESIGHYLGYQRKTYSNYSDGNLADIYDCLDSGYRRFLRSRQWRFVRQHASLYIWPDASGTLNASAPVYDGATYSTLTATASKFYNSMVGKTIVLSGGSSFTIAVYVSATAVKVAGDQSGEAADQTFTIDSEDAFDLPDDFGHMKGLFTFPAGENIVPCANVNEEEIRRKMGQSDSVGTPFEFAVRRKTSWTGTAGPRWEATFYYPTDTAYLMLYAYDIYVPYQIRNATSYAVGGMPHTQTILDLSIAHAERRYKKIVKGPEEMAALESLAASFMEDDSLAADSVGMMVDTSDYRGPIPLDITPTVLFNGAAP